MSGPRILMIDADASATGMAQRAVASFPVSGEMFVTGDAHAAIEWLFGPGHRAADGGPDVILLDPKLPDAGGTSLLRRIRDDPVLRLVPVVVFSSSHDEKDIAEAYAQGANAYVAKPDDPQECERKLQVLLSFWTMFNRPAHDPRAETDPVI